MAGAGAVALVAVLVATVSSVRSTPPVVAVPPPVDSGSTAPYDVPGCPAALPDLQDAALELPDLDEVVAVRFCPDLAPVHESDDTPTADELAWLADRDAVVTGIDRFVDDVRAAPPFDAGRCAVMDFLVTRASLALDLRDGSRVLVAVPACEQIGVDGRQVDASSIGGAFGAALDRQRDALAYTRATDRPLTCDGPRASDDARSDRERVVAAVWCPRQDSAARAITGDELTRLATAWSAAGEVSRDDDGTGLNRCTDLEERPAEVVVRTDRADDVRLFVSPCGELVHDTGVPGGSEAVRVTPDDLGVG